ncbi:DUF3152 domain-containing protein [Streptomyces sp. MA15]|uniref:DUF3152 domain-containing protein n=1 Tax=Streptomyces sp. MA15 TaxID=3055061 RepID=UPI0025B0F34D|nr:DUF3152 domain-containing protein [Streptomyces sp. MA15]MDN3268162.1 DUF3152 domain-containing protein [Streptomyces sp. MA15]
MRSVRERQSAPPTGSSAAARRTGGRRPSSHRRVRPRRRGRVLLTVVLAVALLAAAAFLRAELRGGDGVRGAPDARSPRAAPTPTPPSSPAPAPAAPSPSATRTTIEVPERGSGTFVTARADGDTVGEGPRPLRYVVEVEDGLDVSPSDAAEEIAEILAAPRGWTHDPENAFRLVGAGAPHDLSIKIATPVTADALCWEGIRQDTGGEYNCEVPDGVVVNLRRWVEGSPTFDGPIHDYRALIINHEMGHFLGHSHMTCGGEGRLAPVMMQQIKGLKGCVANAWPYDEDGDLVTGPPA